MKVILFGATGMIGRGALLECLKDPEVERVLAVGRSPCGTQDPKLEDLVLKDLWDYSAAQDRLKGYDACFFCLGTPSAGKSEAEYTRVTYDLTLAAATTLARLDPGMTFVYISGLGADSSEKGSVMWARVRGRAENALLRLPFKAAYVLRPGFVQPLDGIRSRTPLYRFFYAAFSPIIPLLRRAFPRHVATTRSLGQAMLRLARSGAAKKVLLPAEFDDAGAH